MAIVLAIGSFFIGTLLLLLFKIMNTDFLILSGLYYTLLATILNGPMLILVAINAITHYTDYKENLLTILGVLVNIPITFYYIELVFSNPF